MKQVKIATIIRHELKRVGLWEKRWSTTYQDTSYTKHYMTKRYASKFLNSDVKWTDKDGKALVKIVEQRIRNEGHNIESVGMLGRELYVYQKTPITITVDA